MNKSFKAITMLSAALGGAFTAHAAHWVLVSATDATAPVSSVVGSGISRGPRSLITVQIPNSIFDIYGDGKFPFYGETASFAWGPTSPGPVGQNNYTAYTDSYYTFTYQWVSDSPSDVPPPAGASLTALGYSLERATAGQFLNNGFLATSTQWAFTWNAQGNFPSPGPLPSANLSAQFPSTPVLGQVLVTIANELYNVRPVAIGGALVSSNNGVVTGVVSVLNNQTITMNSVAAWGSNGGAPMCWAYDSGVLKCFKGCSLIGGLPVLTP